LQQSNEETRGFTNEEFSSAKRIGECAIVRDTRADPRCEDGNYSELGIAAFVTVQFHQNGVWTNYLAVTDSEPRDWREDEIELFREFSNRIFPRLERARAEEKSQRAAELDAFRAWLADALRPFKVAAQIKNGYSELAEIQFLRLLNIF
jgi:GAF domain-containing protein